MGYACPVCGEPQADGEHLANHLAFTALLHGADHEAWLADVAPDWADRTPAALAATVVEHAEETEHDVEQVEHPSGDRGPVTDGTLDPEVSRVVEEAMAMTRERRRDEE